MTTWYETAMHSGHLKVPKRPPGPTVSIVKPGRRYWIPTDTKSHLPRPDSLDDIPEFFCGRGVWVDPDWYAASGLEAVVGPWWVVEDTEWTTRKTPNLCGPCKTWAAKWFQPSKQPPPPPRDSALNAAEQQAIGLEAKLVKRRLAGQAARVATWFGTTERVDDGEEE